MKTRYKATMMAPVLGLVAIGSQPCEATIIWLQDGTGEKQNTSNTVTDADPGYRTEQLYTQGTHLPNQLFNVGDSFTATFTVTVTSASPDPITWLNNANIAFAVNDDVADHAVGMTFDLTGTENVRTGYDKSAGGAGNFGTLSGTSGGWVNGTVDSEKFLDSGDSALITFTLSKTNSDATGDELVHTVQWGTTAAIASHTIDMSEGVRINQLDEFLFRMNSLDGTGGAATATLGVTNFELDLTQVPEPSSAALLGLGGLALMLRRRK